MGVPYITAAELANALKSDEKDAYLVIDVRDEVCDRAARARGLERLEPLPAQTLQHDGAAGRARNAWTFRQLGLYDGTRVRTRALRCRGKTGSWTEVTLLRFCFWQRSALHWR
jgi:hypothetical protein